MPLVNLPSPAELSISSKEGGQIPDVTVHMMTNFVRKEISTSAFFKGKKVALFSLPGAFTPTCSASHAPGYDGLASLFKKAGVDEIVCIAVNDAHVMDAWKKNLGIQNITFLADGNTDFTAGMGALFNKLPQGFGPRSWRYSMIVDDGKIEKLFIEENVAGDPFDVSDARTMLAHLDMKLLPPQVAMITKAGCPFCAKAKATLDEMGWPVQEIPASTASLGALAGNAGATTPQIFIDGKCIGGSDDLNAFLAAR
ncbi:MAG: glutathione peroxidase [Deltaproteobacteria bacterium]|nr:glutathione peroxidase [Deltaproteobacteria bacterium]